MRFEYKIAAYKCPLFFFLFLLGFLLLLSSCVSYPDLSEVEKISQVERDELHGVEEENSIAQVFQEKAKTFLPSSESETTNLYQVGPEDVLNIQVWDHTDLNRDVTLSREGEFSYPLIGRISADGMTASQLEKDIENRLSGRFIINPQVTVSIIQYKSKRVYVLGEVGGPWKSGQGPGVYPLTGETTLLEVLSRAGGPSREAGDLITVVRPKSESRKQNPVSIEEADEGEVITLNLKKTLEGDINKNILLKHGDTIYVPKAEFFFVYGEVTKEGRYTLEPETTVLKAITMAGGFTDKAATNKVLILRERKGKKVRIPAKMTERIKAEDTVMIPESFF